MYLADRNKVYILISCLSKMLYTWCTFHNSKSNKFNIVNIFLNQENKPSKFKVHLSEIARTVLISINIYWSHSVSPLLLMALCYFSAETGMEIRVNLHIHMVICEQLKSVTAHPTVQVF